MELLLGLLESVQTFTQIGREREYLILLATKINLMNSSHINFYSM